MALDSHRHAPVIEQPVRKFWNPKWQKHTVSIQSGQFYATSEDLVISTLLGSCIAACVWDPMVGVGGMNHFMLPQDKSATPGSGSARFGLYAMEMLINDLMKLGASRSRLEFKITGGGNMMGSDVAQRNIEFIHDFLQTEGFRLAANDVGGTQARRVAFMPVEGRMMVAHLDHSMDNRVVAEERSYLKHVTQEKADTTADVELF